MEERQNKLKELKVLLENTAEQYSLAFALQQYFLGESTTCKCKYNNVRSQLNHFWETTGKHEYIN